MKCLGCKLAKQEEVVHVVFEDEHVCCILDHNPFNEGHVLILSKRHIRYLDELDEDTANSVMAAAKLITKVIKTFFVPDGVTICQNGGIFDELTHFHMHVIPRYDGQNFAEFFSVNGEIYIEDKDRLEVTKRKMIETIKGWDKR